MSKVTHRLRLAQRDSPVHLSDCPNPLPPMLRRGNLMAMGDVRDDQARPAEGRVLPTKALGTRPSYFDDDGATDALVQMVTALTAEVWSLRERLTTLEHLLGQAGVVDPRAVDGYRPDDEEQAARRAAAGEFTSRVFRVFDELREAAAAGEGPNDYTALVDRAYEEL